MQTIRASIAETKQPFRTLEVEKFWSGSIAGISKREEYVRKSKVSVVDI